MKKNYCFFSNIIIVVILFHSPQAYSQGQKWMYKPSFGTPYFLERTYINDSTYEDKYYDSENSYSRDTFFIRSKEILFKRGENYYSYISEASFTRNDTIRYLDQEPINKWRTMFTTSIIYIPNKKETKDSLLVYTLVDPMDDPRHSTSRIYYDPSKNLIVKFEVIDGTIQIVSNK